MGVTLLCTLGYWQLSRAQEKKSMISQWDSAHTQPVLTMVDLLALSNSTKKAKQYRYTPVALSTHFLNEYTILLDNKTNNGQAGYHVLTPVQVDDNTVILVDRGWVPLGRSRSVLPTLLPIKGKIPIEGYLDFAYRNRFVEEAIETGDIKWPLRVQQLSFQTLSALMGKTVLPMLVKLDSSSPYGFTMMPRQNEWLNPARHYGYATQWFLLALTLVIFYLRGSTLQKR